MQPGDIFWAAVPVGRPPNLEPHPAIFFKALDDGIVIFGGTSLVHPNERLLHTVDFSQSCYRTLHFRGINRPTYFYYRFFQPIPIGQIRSGVLDTVELEDFDELLRAVGLLG
ncbi:MAG TPA: hypothetical protein VEK08_00475 [Planctomycetota bacterium]|nr:hypothetical protein [Planctomycetota bacterium]